MLANRVRMGSGVGEFILQSGEYKAYVDNELVTHKSSALITIKRVRVNLKGTIKVHYNCLVSSKIPNAMIYLDGSKVANSEINNDSNIIEINVEKESIIELKMTGHYIGAKNDVFEILTLKEPPENTFIKEVIK